MKKVLVFGYFGYNNFGDELLLKSILIMIKKFSDCDIYVLYNKKNGNKFANNFSKDLCENVVLVSRWNFFKIIRIMLGVDTVICAGGLFQDTTSNFSLFYYLTIIKIAKLLDKKVLIFGTEFNVKNSNKKMLIKNLEKVDYIGIRNGIEFNNFEIFREKLNIDFFPDMSFIFYEKNFNNKEKNILGIILKSPDKKRYKQELSEIVSFCKKVNKRYKIYLIPLHLGKDNFSEDYLFAIKILNKVEMCCIKVWNNVEELKNIFEEVKFFVVSRFHGIIMCLMCEKKFFCVSNNLKLTNFVKDIGMGETLVSTYDKIDINKIENIEKNFVGSFEHICMGYKNKLEEKFLQFKQKGWI